VLIVLVRESAGGVVVAVVLVRSILPAPNPDLLCPQALDTAATSCVPRPEFVIALDVLRKELDGRVGAARAAGEQVDGNLKETLQQVWGPSGYA
jgi:hypothetical protein